MPKRNRPSRTPSRKAETQPAVIPQSSPPNAVPADNLTAGQRAGQAVVRVLNSGVDYALDHFWGAVWSAVVVAAAAVWLYIRSGQTPWLYPWLTHIAAFAGGWLGLTLLIAFLALRKSHRLKAAAEFRSAKFASTKKGLLDHRLNFERSKKEYQALLGDIARETERSGETASKIGRKLQAFEHSAWLSHRFASRGAARINQQAQRLERTHYRFEEVTNLLIESMAGISASITPDLIEVIRASIETTIAYRDSILVVVEQNISQDLSTAFNRLIHVTEGNIALLEKTKSHWEKLLRTTDGELNTQPQLGVDSSQNEGGTPSS